MGLSFSGQQAVPLLAAIESRCELYKKDNTDKMWSYKLKRGRRSELAFDPTTTTHLTVRLDVQPPAMPGLSNPVNIESDSVSTALARVFSGGSHTARWKVDVEDEYALVRLVEYLEKHV
ncbi:MAG: hypothetical protein KIS79_14325 [Burkholderiales bacterium]|nr:hypothetical protein [Burkholderiales bacterium]